ncbi:DMT family transporter [Macrococcus sp. EM39E]|uniref:DMT family transporter n=1 Tax=Macrococcus animalis TaxID=3395467 RepID=UPI0039BE8550
MIYILLALMIGLMMPIQTAVNSRLRTYVLSPFMASFISFLVGTLFLFIMTLATKHSVLIPLAVFQNNPFWIWLGGLLGVIGLTTNILLFPKLGGVQTVVLPIMGQILMSMMIDHFGLFYSPEKSFTLLRLVGIVILIIGVFCVIVLPDYLRKKNHGFNKENDSINKLPFQIAGIIAGMMMASQSAINGHLGGLLNSAVHAAFVSFLVGTTVLLLLVTIVYRQLGNFKLALGKDKPLWIWCGGILGSFFVLIMAYLVPLIGTGLVVVICLFGQILCSVAIDTFGLLGAQKAPVTRIQVLGLCLLFCAVIFIRFF